MDTGWKLLLGLSLIAAITFAILYFRKSVTAYSNVEKYTWIDYRGNKRELIITRDAEVIPKLL